MKRQLPRSPEPIERPPLIVQDKGQSLFQRYGFRALTILFWVLFLSLFRIAVTPFAWFIGAQNVYEFFSYKVEADDFFQLLSLYVLIVLVIGFCLVGWARYNQFRFQRRERRTIFRAPAGQKETATFFQLPKSMDVIVTGSRRMTFHHDETGQLIDIDAALSPILSLPIEPLPVMRYSYSYRGYLLERDADLRWQVKLDAKLVYSDPLFEKCRKYVDLLTG